MEPLARRRARLVASLLLTVTVATAYAPALTNGFVSHDDERYVVANPHVRQGLTADALRWAWTAFYASNWHPLTWMSHMLDWQLYGERPAGHHLTNVLLHLANALILLLVLESLTGAPWRAAFVALAFAVHPLHVESVAWVAERKDLLSTTCWFLALAAYVRYVRGPTVSRYFVVAGLMALGLCAKPMVVTLPLTLICLDVWPLRRIRLPPAGLELRPWLEKLPLLSLSAASSVITVAAQRAGGSLGSLESYTVTARIANALVAYATYLRKTFWPFDLAVHYPHPRGGTTPEALTLSCALLLAVSVVAWIARRERPWLVAGWSWYLVTLVPVIGLVQVGQQAWADRYTYVPLVGIFVIVSWGGWGVAETLGARRRVWAAVAATLVVVAMVGATRAQLAHWRDSEALFRRALAVNEENAVAHNELGLVLSRLGRIEEALVQYRRAIELRPEFPEAHNNMGGALAARGDVAGAIEQHLRALQLAPAYPEAANNLGVALARSGRLEEAIAAFERAVALRPSYGKAHANLAAALLSSGAVEAARREVELARAAGFEPPAELTRRLGELPAD
jgi:Flp pilus assembly protein TadD